MLKRLMIGLAAGALVAAMLPGVASAGGPKDMVTGSATFTADRSHVTVHARSDANGANASGTYGIHVGDLPAGDHEVSWDGRNTHGQKLSAGVYLYRIASAQGDGAGKVVLIR